MKKILSIIIFIALLILTPTCILASNTTPKVYLNGESILFPDAKPFVDENGRTQVPVRFISEALKSDVKWDAETKTITINLGNDTIVLGVNKKEYQLNGKVKYMDTACVLKDGRTFVPLRFVSEALGAVVNWDGSTNSVKINKTVSNGANKTFKAPGKVTIGNTTYLVDNKYVNFSGLDPDEMSEIYNGILLIPIKKLAEIFNGEYIYSSADKKATLTIDGSKFEFKSSSDVAKINGADVKMPCEANFRNRVVKVPAKVFIGNLNSYEVKMFNETALLMRNKSVYNGKGEYITPNTDFQFTSYKDELKKSQWSTPEETAEMINKVDKISDEIVSSISYDGMTDYEKVLAVNKYMIENIEYDLAFKSKYWDAFLSKKAVCSGFSYATGLLLEKMGVKSIDVTGYGGVEGYEDYDKYELLNYSTNLHGWNIVYVDGKYYHLDTTYNQGLSEKSDEKCYNYLLLSDENMAKDHSWRKGIYPVCENFYDEKTINELKKKGFAVVQGDIKLNKEVGDVYVKINASSVSKPLLYSEKIIRVTSDKPSNFAMVFDKEFKQNDINVEFSILKNRLGGGVHDETIASKIKVNKNNSFYNVSVEPQIPNLPIEYTWKMNVPSGVTIDMAYPFIMDINYYDPVDNAFKGHKFLKGTLLANDNTIKFEEVLPMEFVNYTIEFDFDTVYRGRNEAVFPFIEKGFVDGNGNYSSSEVTINGKEHPFSKVSINLAQNENQEVIKDDRLAMNDSDIKMLKEQLIAFNYGNHTVMKTLVTNDDILKLEGAEPRDIDGNDNYYYNSKMSNGIELFRHYNIKQKNYSSFYSISLDNIKITEDNFIDVFKIFNELLKEQLKDKTLKEPNVYIEDEEDGAISKDIYAEGVFDKMLKGYAQLETSYTKDNFTYLLSIGGAGDGEIFIHFNVIKK